jgi:hypothetical protein
MIRLLDLYNDRCYVFNHHVPLQSIKPQITSLYGGPLEFLFVVESKDDPAYHAVSRLISEYKVRRLHQ